MVLDQILNAIAFPAGLVGLVLGILLVLFAERYIRCLRRWMHMQQRMIRRPVYLRMHKFIGWALVVASAALLALLAIQGGRA